MSRSTDGGRTWEPNRPIYSDPTCPCCRTSVAVAANGAIYVAWRAILPGDIRDVVVTRSTDGGDDLGRAGAGPGRRLGLSRVPACRAFARGGCRAARCTWPGGPGRRARPGSITPAPPTARRRSPPSRSRPESGAPGPRPARGRGRPRLRRLGRRPGRHAPGPAAPVHRRRRHLPARRALERAGGGGELPGAGGAAATRVAVAWSQTTAAEHRAKLAAMVGHEEPQGGDAAAAGGAVGDPDAGGGQLSRVVTLTGLSP